MTASARPGKRPRRAPHRPGDRQSTHVKTLRIVLLVLLAFLLPIRGAVAAAMLCPGGGDGRPAAVALEPGHHETHAAHGMHDDHAAAHHHHADDDTPDAGAEAASSSGGHQPACQICASGCCVTPLAFAPPSVQGPRLSATVSFPALCAPVPAFQSDGQDRPPRTI